MIGNQAEVATSRMETSTYEVPQDRDKARRQITGGVWTTLRYGLLLLYMFICIYPFLWMFATSLRDQRGVFTAGTSLFVSNPSWANYAEIWSAMNVPRAAFNTALVTAVVMILTIFTTSMTA